MTTRPATHAGTWYSADRTLLCTHAAAQLDHMLTDWLRATQSASATDAAPADAQVPRIAQHSVVKGCKAVIGPYVVDADAGMPATVFLAPRRHGHTAALIPRRCTSPDTNAAAVSLYWAPRTTRTWMGVR